MRTTLRVAVTLFDELVAPYAERVDPRELDDLRRAVRADETDRVLVVALRGAEPDAGPVRLAPLASPTLARLSAHRLAGDAPIEYARELDLLSGRVTPLALHP